MDSVLSLFTPAQMVFALAVGIGAGFVKGVVGFAMPLILISGLTMIIDPALALAGLILPTLVTNAYQALRQGGRAAWSSIRLFRVFLIALLMVLVLSAQLVRILPAQLLLVVIGVPIVFFALLQLSGYRFQLRRRTVWVEALVGGFAGAVGGVSGVWGPPTVAYLTALGTAKQDQMRVQGVIYGLGSIGLFAAHIGSGVLNAQTWPFSAALVIPAGIGMWLGGLVSDRIDQESFRRATLVVLLVAGLNLLRRAFF